MYHRKDRLERSTDSQADTLFPSQVLRLSKSCSKPRTFQPRRAEAFMHDANEEFMLRSIGRGADFASVCDADSRCPSEILEA